MSDKFWSFAQPSAKERSACEERALDRFDKYMDSGSTDPKELKDIEKEYAIYHRGYNNFGRWLKIVGKALFFIALGFALSNLMRGADV